MSREGTVSVPAGRSDFCPPCGVQRPIDGTGRFHLHRAANVEGAGPDGECWAGGRNRAEVEEAEAMAAGVPWNPDDPDGLW